MAELSFKAYLYLNMHWAKDLLQHENVILIWFKVKSWLNCSMDRCPTNLVQRSKSWTTPATQVPSLSSPSSSIDHFDCCHDHHQYHHSQGLVFLQCSAGGTWASHTNYTEVKNRNWIDLIILLTISDESVNLCFTCLVLSCLVFVLSFINVPFHISMYIQFPGLAQPFS